MASRNFVETRGPKIGDAASLWNFTPSPGWTKEEAQILKLCLMKYGIGRWVQILETGLLPGKLIQQLNGQTQRLLGQQSLAAYTGLRVDIDRVRADNEARVDAPRKSGLIINTGPNLTREDKERLQMEAAEKYGLTEDQIEQVHKELEKLATQILASRLDLSSETDYNLLNSDASSLSKKEKLNLLKALHQRLQKVHNVISNGANRSASLSDLAGMMPLRGSNRERSASAIQANNSHKLSKGSAKERKIRRASASKASSGRKRNSNSTDIDDDDFKMKEAGEAEKIARESDISTLMAMGFGERQARDALEEADGNLEIAAEWIVSHCI